MVDNINKLIFHINYIEKNINGNSTNNPTYSDEKSKDILFRTNIKFSTANKPFNHSSSSINFKKVNLDKVKNSNQKIRIVSKDDENKITTKANESKKN